MIKTTVGCAMDPIIWPEKKNSFRTLIKSLLDLSNQMFCAFETVWSCCSHLKQYYLFPGIWLCFYQLHIHYFAEAVFKGMVIVEIWDPKDLGGSTGKSVITVYLHLKMRILVFSLHYKFPFRYIDNFYGVTF